MSLEVMEKLLVGMVPPEALAPVHSNFELMRTQPAEAFAGLWNYMHPILMDQEHAGHIAAVNGIMIGIALAHGLDRSIAMQKLIADYLKDRSRKRGENVVNFYEARAGRGTC